MNEKKKYNLRYVPNKLTRKDKKKQIIEVLNRNHLHI